jgi:glyoxylase-like metal-dependent hydrolase (beta-lactamase superfamily II)
VAHDDVVRQRYAAGYRALRCAATIPHVLQPIADASGATLLDLEYRGEPESLATLVLESNDGLAVIDPGPTVTLPTLLAGTRELAGGDENALRHVFLTHVHLDHGGCAGVLAARLPNVTIYVHERGAPHIVDPARLLASATRLYGDRMQELWGDVMPTPSEQVRIVRNGERLTSGSREILVAYTPGHAIHHAAFLDVTTGLAYVGDAAGERFHSGTPILPTTPPPDIDLEAWRESTSRLRAGQPSGLVLSHFGVFRDALPHLEQHEAALEEWATAVRVSLDEPGTDDERASRFAAARLATIRAAATQEGASRVHFSQIRDCWFGLARYWRRRGVGVSR